MECENYRTIGDTFKSTARRFPNKIAVIYLGTRFTYDRLYRLGLSFAHSLSDMGIQAGDRVIIYLPNSPQWIISWIGTILMGATAVPITPIYLPNDLKYIANDSEAKAIICADTNFGYVMQVLAETKIKAVIHTNVADLLPFWKRAFGELFKCVPKGHVASNSSVPFRRILRSAPELPQSREISEEDIAVLLYTGGTTKFPKGVPYSHRFFLKSAEISVRLPEPAVKCGENIQLQGAPLYHVIGQLTGIGILILCGDTNILMPGVNIDAMLYAIQRNKVKCMYGVPAFFRMILDHDRLDFYDLNSLKFCYSGGDVLPTEIEHRWKDRFGFPLHQGYGSTEAGGAVTSLPTNQMSPPKSMGLLIQDKTVRIVNQETLEEVTSGQPGELLVHSDPMITYYWNKPEETKESFIEIDGRLWYRTGDIVSRDDEGFFFFVDRTVDTIKHKGYRVSASEIEATLLEHPAVMAAIVVGVPDEKVGDRIKAYVVLKEDIKGMTGYDLIRWCKERLLPYKVPQYIEFRDMLPKSKVGKLLRREIRNEEQKRVEKGKWEEVLD